jgi:hypothetical protein
MYGTHLIAGETHQQALYLTLHLTTTMCGHKLSEDLCNITIRMLPVPDISDIEAYTGVSRSRIERVQTLYNRKGHGYKARDTRVMGGVTNSHSRTFR